MLIVGAGSGGEIAVRELLRNPNLGRKVAGFVDDDRLKHGRRIHGYPVLGGHRGPRWAARARILPGGPDLDSQAVASGSRAPQVILRTAPAAATSLPGSLLDDLAAAPPRVEHAVERPVELLGVALVPLPRARSVAQRRGRDLGSSSPRGDGARDGLRGGRLAAACAGRYAARLRGGASTSRAFSTCRPRELRDRSRRQDRRPHVQNLQGGLTATWSVSEEGTVVFPLLGPMKLAGSTEREATARVARPAPGVPGSATDHAVGQRVPWSASVGRRCRREARCIRDSWVRRDDRRRHHGGRRRQPGRRDAHVLHGGN